MSIVGRMVLVLCLGAIATPDARAADAPAGAPQWGIILTVIDVTTGKKVEEHELDADSRFESEVRCQSILLKVGPIPSSTNFVGHLSCRVVAR